MIIAGGDPTKINQNLISRNHTPVKRTKQGIQWIVIHYVGALGDAHANTQYYKTNDAGASADFFVGHGGDVWQANDYYNYYSWHCGGGTSGTYFGRCTNANSVGIEMCVRKRSTATMNASDPDWYFEDATVKAAAELTKYLMAELDIDAEHVIRHYDVNGKWCPAPYCANNTTHTWAEFKRLIGQAEPTQKELINATQLNGMSEAEKVQAMAPLYQAEQRRSGMLASVGLAQFCLESGYGTTDLAQKANNLHGMKCSLSGNTWAGSSWDGKSKYTKQTAEQTTSGQVYYVTADFRKYPSMADSIADRSAYFIGAMNGSAKRYPGINQITSAEEQVKLIKAGGYATDVSYVNKLMSLINRFDLTQYDTQEVAMDPITKAAQEMDKTMQADNKAGKQWTYTNKKSIPATFDEARTKGTRRTNCARGVTWLLIEAGILKSNPGQWYGKKDGTLVFKSKSAETAIKEAFDITKIGSVNKTVNQCIKDGTIKAGDIVTYKASFDHTNLYLGDGKWFDTGHAYCKTPGEDAKFIKWVGDTYYGGTFVGCVLRQKKKVEPAPTTLVMYRVQAGAFSVKANAQKCVELIKSQTGEDSFIDYADGLYKVICGSFSIKANAEQRVSVLQAKGISCFIVEK